MTGRPLVLASTSPYRRELLERLRIPFTTAAPQFDEATHDVSFAVLEDTEFAMELARGKAESLRSAWPDAWILAADQIAVLPEPQRELLRKPLTVERATRQLLRLAGRTHVLTTAVTLFDTKTGAHHLATDVHRMTMRPFSRPEAEAYVEACQPLDCVGAYRIEDAGIALFQKIEGSDQTGIIGLPLIAVSRLLREVGLLT